MALKNSDRIAADLRRHRALEMKVAGATDRQIAEAEGVSVGLINRDIKKKLSQLDIESGPTADELRALQMERYNKLLMRNWPGALAGEKEPSERVLKIMNHINQICGLIPDKPLISMNLLQQTLLTDNSTFTFEIEAPDNDNDNEIQKTASLPETI